MVFEIFRRFSGAIYVNVSHACPSNEGIRRMSSSVYKNDMERVCHRIESFPTGVYVPRNMTDQLMQLKVPRLKHLLLTIRYHTKQFETNDLAGIEKRDLVELLQCAMKHPVWLNCQLKNHNVYHPALESTPGTCDEHIVEAAHSFLSNRTECGCSICLEEYEPFCKLLILPCGHMFHYECAKQWLTTQLDVTVDNKEYPSCPSCRVPINKRSSRCLLQVTATDTSRKKRKRS